MMKNMKKLSLCLLTLCLLLSLCACGAPTTQETMEETADVTEMPAVGPAAPETAEEPAAGDDACDLAAAMIGRPVQELFAVVGEPNAADYAPSCLGPGEDGELCYDGFTVYTYREGDKEVVEDVYVEN